PLHPPSSPTRRSSDLPAPASLIYLHTPTITGEDPTPGYPGAMNLRSLTINRDAFSIVKRVDSASPQLTAAVVGGTTLATTRALQIGRAHVRTPVTWPT